MAHVCNRIVMEIYCSTDGVTYNDACNPLHQLLQIGVNVLFALIHSCKHSFYRPMLLRGSSVPLLFCRNIVTVAACAVSAYF